MITMQDARNPDAARQTFQIENEMAAVPLQLSEAGLVGPALAHRCEAFPLPRH